MANKNNTRSNFHLRPLALAVTLALSGVLPNISKATTYVVTNTSDNIILPGSLRNAVAQANDVTPDEADIIEIAIAPGSTINLGSELFITDSLIIKGPVAGDKGSVILNAGGTHRHIASYPTSQYLDKLDLTLENITFTNGSTSTPYDGGGAIRIDDTNLILNHVAIINNATTGKQSHGGGIFNKLGTVTVNESLIAGNSTAGQRACGGGIGSFLGHGMTLNKSTVSGNATTGHSANGGGLCGDRTVIINESTISGNSVSGGLAKGGGIYVDFASFSLKQSTVSGNSVTSADSWGGGGIFLRYNSSAELIQSTITENSSLLGAGGLFTNRDTYSINTILSGNTGPEGNLKAGSSNFTPTNSIFGDDISETTDIDNDNNNIITNSPRLGPLQFNGGITQTHKPKSTADSPAPDHGSNTAAAEFSNDQRGNKFPRIHNLTVDIGAVELQIYTMAGDPPPSFHEVLTRRDMAREMLKAIEGEDYHPPAATGTMFEDVPLGSINADWIEEFSRIHYSDGCAPNRFCPDMVVTKEQMAKSFIEEKYPLPAPTTNTFYDVPNGSFGWEFITKMRDNGWSDGCKTIQIPVGIPPNISYVTKTLYCPKKPVTREWFNTLLGFLP